MRVNTSPTGFNPDAVRVARVAIKEVPTNQHANVGHVSKDCPLFSFNPSELTKCPSLEGRWVLKIPPTTGTALKAQAQGITIGPCWMTNKILTTFRAVNPLRKIHPKCAVLGSGEEASPSSQPNPEEGDDYQATSVYFEKKTGHNVMFLVAAM